MSGRPRWQSSRKARGQDRAELLTEEMHDFHRPLGELSTEERPVELDPSGVHELESEHRIGLR